jgi:hypothetical protein
MTNPAPYPRKQVTKSRKKTRHGLHLVLTLCTCGVWAIIGWPWVWMYNAFGPRDKSVTHYD